MDEVERDNINIPCKICRQEKATVLNGYCAECYKKEKDNFKFVVTFCPDCTKGVPPEEMVGIIDILHEFDSKLEFVECPLHQRNRRDSKRR